LDNFLNFFCIIVVKNSPIIVIPQIPLYITPFKPKLWTSFIVIGSCLDGKDELPNGDFLPTPIIFLLHPIVRGKNQKHHHV